MELLELIKDALDKVKATDVKIYDLRGISPLCDFTVVATVDKATGNLIALNLNAPCILGLDAKLLAITMNGAKVGIQVISEFAMTY